LSLDALWYWSFGLSLSSPWSISIAPVPGNALNLSPIPSSEFVRKMEMGLRFFLGGGSLQAPD
jgi:hypothetical protein